MGRRNMLCNDQLRVNALVASINTKWIEVQQPILEGGGAARVCRATKSVLLIKYIHSNPQPVEEVAEGHSCTTLKHELHYPLHPKKVIIPINM